MVCSKMLFIRLYIHVYTSILYIHLSLASACNALTRIIQKFLQWQIANQEVFVVSNLVQTSLYHDFKWMNQCIHTCMNCPTFSKY